MFNISVNFDYKKNASHILKSSRRTTFILIHSLSFINNRKSTILMSSLNSHVSWETLYYICPVISKIFLELLKIKKIYHFVEILRFQRTKMISLHCHASWDTLYTSSTVCNHNINKQIINSSSSPI